MRGDVQKRLYPEPMNLYYTVVQLATVKLILILQYILGFHSQSINFKNAFAQADITSGEPFFIELTRNFKIYGGLCVVVLRLKKSLYGQPKSARLWYENLRNGLLKRAFMMSKVDLCLFMSKTVICVVYVDDCLFWSLSQYDIDDVMKYFKEDNPSYYREHSKRELVSYFLGIDINTLDDGGFKFCQTGLIRKVSEATWMEHCNGLPTTAKVKAPLGTDTNGYEARRYLTNSYASVLGMMLYL